MTTNKIQLRLYRILRELGIARSKISLQTNLYDDLGFDSFDMTCLFYFIESRFGVRIGNHEMVKFSTVANSINYINFKVNNDKIF